MGRPLSSILADFAPEEQALLADYEAALRRAGVSTALFPSKAAEHCLAETMGASVLGNHLGSARRFLQTVGLEAWPALSVERQVGLLKRFHSQVQTDGLRHFICWLALTGRQPFSIDFLKAVDTGVPTLFRWLEHGRIVWPDVFARVTDVTLKLGYVQTTADAVCRSVTRAAAYLRKSPDSLTLDELVSLSDLLREGRARWRAERGLPPPIHEHQPLNPWTTATVLYHAGILPEPPDTHLISRRPGAGIEVTQLGFLAEKAPHFHELVMRYVEARRNAVRPSTLKQDICALGDFFRWLTSRHPEVTELGQMDRRAHVDPYIRFVLNEAGPGRGRKDEHWSAVTRYQRLDRLRHFFRLLSLWGWPEAPVNPPLLVHDMPQPDQPLPKAFDDVDAARMIQIARTSANPLQRLVIELLASCGLRASEARDLKLSDIVSFGGPAGQAAQPWLHVPLGKLGNDRYVPIGPELQAALDVFLMAQRSTRDWEGLTPPPAWTSYLLARKGKRVSAAYVNQVSQRIGATAGVADTHAHRWRHTFATQAINRGMDLASIATLLGHVSLDMTMVYARIANPQLRKEFDRVSQQVQAFYTTVANDPPGPDSPVSLPPGALGPAMVVARREMEWRRLGNGWCTRRAYLDCRYELVCERCIHFNTDRLCLPVLELQHEDAVRKGQQARIDVLTKVITSLQAADEPLAAVGGADEVDLASPNTENKKGALA